MIAGLCVVVVVMAVWIAKLEYRLVATQTDINTVAKQLNDLQREK